MNVRAQNLLGQFFHPEVPPVDPALLDPVEDAAAVGANQQANLVDRANQVGQANIFRPVGQTSLEEITKLDLSEDVARGMMRERIKWLGERFGPELPQQEKNQILIEINAGLNSEFGDRIIEYIFEDRSYVDRNGWGGLKRDQLTEYVFALPGDPCRSLSRTLFLRVNQLRTFERKLILVNSENQTVRECLLNSKETLVDCSSIYTLADRATQKKYIELLNDATGPQYDELWEMLEDQSMFNLQAIYGRIKDEIKPQGYKPTPLHKKLFSIMLKHGNIGGDLAKELEVPEFRSLLMEDQSAASFLAFVFALKRNLPIFQSNIEETKNKILNLGLLLFSKGEISEDQLHSYLELLKIKGSFQLWERIPLGQRTNFLRRVAAPQTSQGESLSNILCYALAKELCQDTKQFGELSPEEKNLFFYVLHRYKKLDKVPPLLYADFCAYIKIASYKDKYLLTNWENLASQVQTTPLELLSMLSRFDKVVNSDFLVNAHLHLYLQIRDYLTNLKIPVQNIMEAYFRACNHEFSNLNEADRSILIHLTIKYKRFKDVSGSVIVYLLDYLTKNPLVKKDPKLDEKSNLKLFSDTIKALFDRIKKDTSLTTPPLLILKALEKQRQILINEKIILDDEPFRKILYIILDPIKFKELSDCLAEKSTSLEDQERQLNLTTMAIYICSLAQVEQDSKGQVDEGVKSILSKINISRLPITVFIREFSEGIFSSVLKTHPDVYLQTANEEQLEQYYRTREKGLSVNWHHLRIGQPKGAATVPPLPAGVSVEYEGLLKLFHEINFTDSKKADYVDPSILDDQGTPMTVGQAERGIGLFISKISNKDGPTYSPRDPGEKAEYMNFLEKWVKHSILLLGKKAPKDRAFALSKIASAGYHCGGAIFPATQDIYSELSGQTVSYENITLLGYITKLLDAKRKAIFDGIFAKMAGYDGQNTHTIARAMRDVGMPFGVAGWYNYTDPLVGEEDPYKPLRNKASLAECLWNCRLAYNPTVIVNELYKHINGIPGHPSTLPDNSETRVLALELWFKGNMGKKFEKDFIKGRHKQFLGIHKDKLVAKELIQFENNLFVKSIKAQFVRYNQNMNEGTLHEMDAELEKFFDQYNSEKEAIEASLQQFDMKAKGKINRNETERDILSRCKGQFKGDLKQAVKDVREQLFDIQYRKAMIQSDEYQDAVLSEIYHLDEVTGKRTLKREKIIYMLENISLQERQNVLLKRVPGENETVAPTYNEIIDRIIEPKLIVAKKDREYEQPLPTAGRANDGSGTSTSSM